MENSNAILKFVYQFGAYMKRIFPYLFTLMALAAVALCLSSCNKEKETPVVGDTASFTGKWECFGVDNPPEGVDLYFNIGDKITFKGNGIYELVHPTEETEGGTWIITSSKLIIKSDYPTQTLRFSYSLGGRLTLRQDVNGQIVIFGLN